MHSGSMSYSAAASRCVSDRSPLDRKSTRLNSSHSKISYAVFCLKKNDLLRVTKGKTDEGLARQTIRQSTDLGGGMTTHGVRFQPPLEGTLHLGRTNAFLRRGGNA